MRVHEDGNSMPSDVQKKPPGGDVRGDNSDSIHATSREEKTPIALYPGTNKSIIDAENPFFLSPESAQTIVSTHGCCLWCR